MVKSYWDWADEKSHYRHFDNLVRIQNGLSLFLFSTTCSCVLPFSCWQPPPIVCLFGFWFWPSLGFRLHHLRRHFSNNSRSFFSTWVKKVMCKEQQRSPRLPHHKLENNGRGVQFQQIIDWLKMSTFTPLVKAAEEDLYWRVCRMMTKDGAQEVGALAAISNFLPNYFPHTRPPIPNILCGLKE